MLVQLLARALRTSGQLELVTYDWHAWPCHCQEGVLRVDLASLLLELHATDRQIMFETELMSEPFDLLTRRHAAATHQPRPTAQPQKQSLLLLCLKKHYCHSAITAFSSPSFLVKKRAHPLCLGLLACCPKDRQWSSHWIHTREQGCAQQGVCSCWLQV